MDKQIDFQTQKLFSAAFFPAPWHHIVPQFAFTLFCALKVLLWLSCIIITLRLEARGEWELESVLLTGQTCCVSPEAGIRLYRLTQVPQGLAGL